MLCPDDGTKMHQVKIESHYGQPIILEQCGECGGIWFDKSELYRARHGEGDKIEDIDSKLLRKKTYLEKENLYCPRDGEKLIRFEDQHFLKEIIIERCVACDGFWFDRGEFVQYQVQRKGIQKKRSVTEEDMALREAIEGALERDGKEETFKNILRIAQFLGTPIDPLTFQPLQSEKLSEKDQKRITLLVRVLIQILRVLM